MQRTSPPYKPSSSKPTQKELLLWARAEMMAQRIIGRQASRATEFTDIVQNDVRLSHHRDFFPPVIPAL